ncbi:MAG: hypothetical protein ACI8QH_001389, partial [Flammeovirgaceae bacterium]
MASQTTQQFTDPPIAMIKNDPKLNTALDYSVEIAIRLGLL